MQYIGKTVATLAACVVTAAIVTASLVWMVQLTKIPVRPTLIGQEWWEHAVIYQIYPRSFMDSDDDGVGDIKGITSRLEYFVESGITAFWMSPIFTSPMIDMGYDISDFYNIHKDYGTMTDFEELLTKARNLNIKVLLDFVPNHASTDSNYFKKSEAREPGYENFFIWADPKNDSNNSSNRLRPSNWISQFGGSVWEWSEKRQQYYLHQFAKSQADFNFREPAVKKEMLNILKFWFDKGVDGFRLDALPHLFEADPENNGGVYPDEVLTGKINVPPGFLGYTRQDHIKNQLEIYDVVYEWREFTKKYAAENNGKVVILLAEAYCPINDTMLYYENDKGRKGVHFPFNFDLIQEVHSYSNARDFVYILYRWLTYMPPGNVANWVLGNHDNIRVSTRFSPNMVDGLNALNMMLPGVANTYQGEELGMKDGYVSWEDTVDVLALSQASPKNYMDFSRDPRRTPFHWNNLTNAGFSNASKTWLPLSGDYKQLNLKAQKEANRSHYKVYQTLTQLRKAPALSHGQYLIRALSKKTLILVRHLTTYDTYALLFNVRTEKDTVDLSKVSYLSEPLTVYISSVHSKTQSGERLHCGIVTLSPGEAIVFRATPAYE